MLPIMSMLLGGFFCLIIPTIILVVLIVVLRGQANGLAILSLITGILGFFLLPIVGSIAALVSGNMYLNQIRDNPPADNSASLARAGIILGWIGLGFVLIAVLGGILFLIPARVISGPM